MSGKTLENPEDILNLSDEEMANLLPPEGDIPMGEADDPAGSGDTTEGTQDGEENTGDAGADDSEDDAENVAKGSDDTEEEDGEEDTSAGSKGGNEGATAQKDRAQDPAGSKDGEAEGADTKAKAKTGADETDYKALYEQVMAPFKANGRDVQAKSPQEVVRLMQMGANYNKKMEALKPNLRLLKMLENNKLLEEGKISYLIDLDRKDPKAIQKLLRESGVDPMDVDTSAEPDYRPGNYGVSDAEMTFSSALEEVASNPAGQQVVVDIHRSWDKQSKDILFEQPDLLSVMRDHKEKGFYDTITAEVERRRTFGEMRNMPFITAYQVVGKELDDRGALAAKPVTETAQSGTPPNSRVVDTRTARPAGRRTADDTNDRARAAAATKSAPKKAAPREFNPLAMSDEEFEQQAGFGRQL